MAFTGDAGPGPAGVVSFLGDAIDRVGEALAALEGLVVGVSVDSDLLGPF